MENVSDMLEKYLKENAHLFIDSLYFEKKDEGKTMIGVFNLKLPPLFDFALKDAKMELEFGKIIVHMSNWKFISLFALKYEEYKDYLSNYLLNESKIIKFLFSHRTTGPSIKFLLSPFEIPSLMPFVNWNRMLLEQEIKIFALKKETAFLSTMGGGKEISLK